MSNDVLPLARESEREREREGQVENYLFLAKIMNEPFRLQGKQRQRSGEKDEGRELGGRNRQLRTGHCHPQVGTHMCV